MRTLIQSVQTLESDRSSLPREDQTDFDSTLTFAKQDSLSSDGYHNQFETYENNVGRTFMAAESTLVISASKEEDDDQDTTSNGHTRTDPESPDIAKFIYEKDFAPKGSPKSPVAATRSTPKKFKVEEEEEEIKRRF